MSGPRGLFDVLDDTFGDEGQDTGALRNLDVTARLEELTSNKEKKQIFTETYCHNREGLLRALRCWERVHMLLAELQLNSLFSSQERNSNLCLLRDTFVLRTAPLSINAPLELVDHFCRLTERAVTKANRPFPPWLLYELRDYCEKTLRQNVVEMLVDKKLGQSLSLSNELDTVSASSSSSSGISRMKTVSNLVRGRTRNGLMKRDSSREGKLSGSVVDLQAHQMVGQLRVLPAGGAATKFEDYCLSYANSSLTCNSAQGDRTIDIPLMGAKVQEDGPVVTLGVPQGSFEFRVKPGVGAEWVAGLRSLVSKLDRAEQLRQVRRAAILQRDLVKEAVPLPVAASLDEIDDDADAEDGDGEEEISAALLRLSSPLLARKNLQPQPDVEEDDPDSSSSSSNSSLGLGISGSASSEETDFARALGSMYGSTGSLDAAYGASPGGLGAYGAPPPGLGGDSSEDGGDLFGAYGTTQSAAASAYGNAPNFMLGSDGSEDGENAGGGSQDDGAPFGLRYDVGVEAQPEGYMGVASPAFSGSASSGSASDEEDDDEQSDGDEGTFNERFQELMNPTKPKDGAKEEDDTYSRNASLLALAEDFLQSARRYGRIILCELFVPEQKKTIKPMSPGGHVWRVRDIVFQLAVDSQNMFDDKYADEMAAKLAGLHMQALSAYFQSSTHLVSFPFLALIDFRGFRLSAFSALPVTLDTLIYGPKNSAEGTKFVTKSRQSISILKRFDEKLNLKASGCLPGSDKVVHGGFGLQMHRSGDRYYMVQFNNAFPCVSPVDSIKGAQFVHLFRPEFVGSYPIPLSPNAYKFPTEPTEPAELKQDRKNIDKATAFLEEVLVPNSAKDITKAVQARKGDRLRISELLHEFGINCRYMGLLCDQMTTENPLHIALIVEMVARVAKNQLRAALRSHMKTLRVSSDNPYIALVVVYFNLMFGKSPASDEWWRVNLVKDLNRCFRFNLKESDSFFMLKEYLFKPRGDDVNAPLLLYQRLKEMTGISFSSSVENLIATNADVFLKSEVFGTSDVTTIGERVKVLDLVWNAKGVLFSVRANQQESRGFFRSARHFYSTSLESFTFALSANPSNSKLLAMLGQVLVKVARLTEAVRSGSKNLASIHLDPDSTFIVRARSAFSRAISADASNPESFAKYAYLLEMLKENDRAEEYYLQALLLDPGNPTILRKYGHFLTNVRDQFELANQFYERCNEARQIRAD